MVYPFKPKLFFIKVGFKGCTFHGHVFLMNMLIRTSVVVLIVSWFVLFAPTVHYENLSMQYIYIMRYVSKAKIEISLEFFYINFAQNIDCGYTLEPPRRGGSNEYPQSMFWNKNKKNRYTTPPPHTHKPHFYIKVGFNLGYLFMGVFS